MPNALSNLVRAIVPKKTEFELSHEIAQRNASLPIEQGGLGLPLNNTAMDRAAALGYPMDMYLSKHKYLDTYNNGKIPNSPLKKAEIIKAELEQNGIPVRGAQASTGSVYLDIPGNPYQVDARYGGGQSIPIEQMRFSTHSTRADGIPINEPDSNFISDVFPKHGNTIDEARQAIKDMIARGGIRSRFAAFDPMQRNSANILAGGALGAVGLGAMMPTESQASVMDQPKENALKRMLLDYGGRVVDRVSHPLQTLATGLKDLTTGNPDEIAMNLMGAGTISKESQAMAKLIREAQAQIEAENAAKNAAKNVLNVQPVDNGVRNALVGFGAGGLGVGGGYYGADYLAK